MAKLSLVYGLRLLPADEMESFDDAAIHLKNGNNASVTMHVIEGSTEQEIRDQLMRSLDAFFEFYPELIPSMVDIHSHICYGVDDGSRSLDESIKMLEMACAGGTTDIVATPHSDLKFHFHPEVVAERVGEMQARMGDRIRIHRGCDFHLFFDNIHNCLENRTPYTINGQRYLMVEFADSSIPKTINDVFNSFLQKNITPVITHPERNALLMGRVGDLVSWVRSGCLTQLTAASFTGRFGKSAEANCRKLMDQKLAHFIASDAHDTEWRPPDMREARAIVAEKWGEDTAVRLFETYPRIALTDQYIDCEDPDDVPEKKSFFSFLKKS